MDEEELDKRARLGTVDKTDRLSREMKGERAKLVAARSAKNQLGDGGTIQQLIRLSLNHTKGVLWADFESRRDVYREAKRLDPERIRGLGGSVVKTRLGDSVVRQAANSILTPGYMRFADDKRSAIEEMLARGIEEIRSEFKRQVEIKAQELEIRVDREFQEMRSLMKDRVTIRNVSGDTHKDVAASVQPGKIYTDRTDIPIRPGDEIIRQTPAGVEEIFIVEDPGFHSGGKSVPDFYEMIVRRADAKPTTPGGMTIYSVSGPNARFNLNSDDSSTNIINQAPPELFQALRDVIEAKLGTSPDREELSARVHELEQEEAGSQGFAVKYAEFMAIAANHMAVFGPFIPALTQLLTGP